MGFNLLPQLKEEIKPVILDAILPDYFIEINIEKNLKHRKRKVYKLFMYQTIFCFQFVKPKLVGVLFK